VRIVGYRMICMPIALQKTLKKLSFAAVVIAKGVFCKGNGIDTCGPTAKGVRGGPQAGSGTNRHNTRRRPQYEFYDAQKAQRNSFLKNDRPWQPKIIIYASSH
jgi:hypothetical protein